MLDRAYALKDVAIFHLSLSEKGAIIHDAQELAADWTKCAADPVYSDFAAALQQAQDKVDEDCQKTSKFERFASSGQKRPYFRAYGPAELQGSAVENMEEALCLAPEKNPAGHSSNAFVTNAYPPRYSGLADGAGVYEFVTLNPWVPQVHALVSGACVGDDTQRLPYRPYCRRTTTHARAGGRVLRTHPRFVLRANHHGARINSFVFVPLVFFQRGLKGVLGCRHNEESRRVDRASAPSALEAASLISNVEDAFQLDECKPSLQ
ncbi:hypothetical protein FB451DRAFT_1373736 [Mycena latifolia]|nr:hypothetical protein FB451DRAFT_1373736 [Mycena latifolia]